MVEIYITPTGYKAFIQDFRRRCSGRRVGTITYQYRTRGGTIKSFQFNTQDEYLVAVRNDAATPWRQLSANEQHYAHMGQVGDVSQPAIETAFNADFTRPYDTWSAHLRMICLLTSEAARSEPIPRQCQRAIQGHGAFSYASVWRFINTYDATRTLNGIGSGVFRALRDEDYR